MIPPSPSLSRLNFHLNLPNIREDSSYTSFLELGIFAVHGSNSTSLQGVGLHNGLLPVRDLACDYTDLCKIKSGERGNNHFIHMVATLPVEKWDDYADRMELGIIGSAQKTLSELNMEQRRQLQDSFKEQPGYTGVSFCQVEHYRNALRYSSMGAEESVFPVLYGLEGIERQCVPSCDSNGCFSEGKIESNHILAIFVPEGKQDVAAVLLEGSPLTDKIQPHPTLFSEWAGRHG